VQYIQFITCFLGGGGWGGGGDETFPKFDESFAESFAKILCVQNFKKTTTLDI